MSCKQRFSAASVSPCEHRFANAGEAVVIIESNAFYLELFLEITVLLFKLLRRILSFPLERSVRFRHEVGHAHRQAESSSLWSVVLVIYVYYLLRYVSDAVKVFVILRWKSYHEIQFNMSPA